MQDFTQPSPIELDKQASDRRGRKGQARNKKKAIIALNHALMRGEMEKAGRLLQDFSTSLGQTIWQEAEIIQLMAAYRLLIGQPASAIALIGRFFQYQTASLSVQTPKTRRAGYSQAIEARLYQTLGRALLAEEQVESARMAFAQSLHLLPEEAAAQAGMGEALMRLGEGRQALSFFKKARRLAPREPTLLVLLSQCYLALGYGVGTAGLKGVIEILEVFRALVAAMPQDGLTHANLGAVLFSARAILLRVDQHSVVSDPLDEAGRCLLKACSLGADTAQTLANLGLVRLGQGLVAHACALLQQAVQKQAAEQAESQLDILLNYGTALYEAGRYDEAEAVFRACESGDKARAEFNRAAIELGRGNFKAGWGHFEQRRGFSPIMLPPELQSLPLWKGEAGEEPVGLYLEQGLGDMVQFLRYLPLAAQYRPIILYSSAEIAHFIKAFMPSLPPSVLFSAFAVDVPLSVQPMQQQSLLSLPYCLKREEEPDKTPYLVAPKHILPHIPKEEEILRIGLCWAGSRAYAFDRRRSINSSQIFDYFSPFAVQDAEGKSKAKQKVQFVSLQSVPEQSDPMSYSVPSWLETPSLSTLEALGRAVASCSLVISVDTLVAHMAGSMGKPLWLLNRYGGDWRWRGPEWYQKTRLFSPTTLAPPETNWREVLQEVTGALAALQEEEDPQAYF